MVTIAWVAHHGEDEHSSIMLSSSLPGKMRLHEIENRYASIPRSAMSSTSSYTSDITIANFKVSIRLEGAFRNCYQSTHRSGLHPRSQPGSHGNSEVEQPKAEIVLGWVTVLALDFRCTPPPMVHPIIVGVYG